MEDKIGWILFGASIALAVNLLFQNFLVLLHRRVLPKDPIGMLLVGSALGALVLLMMLWRYYRALSLEDVQIQAIGMMAVILLLVNCVQLAILVKGRD